MTFPRGSAAIVGVGEAGVGRAAPGNTPLDLIARAARTALDDAGLRLSDVDGLFAASAYHQLPGLSVGEYLGLRPRYTDTTSLGGSSFVAHLGHAATAISAGMCEVALIVYGSTQLSDSGRLVSGNERSRYETPFRPRYSVTMYALAAARHMHQYGTTREQLAAVAVAARSVGAAHPRRLSPLFYCHPGMYGIFAVAEAVCQLRGQAGARQQRADVALVHGNGGALSSQVTALLGTGATL